MNKFLLFITFAIFSVLTVWQVRVNYGASLSDITFNNIEALAGGEGGLDSGNYYITNVTSSSHTCHNGGYSNCNI